MNGRMLQPAAGGAVMKFTAPVRRLNKFNANDIRMHLKNKYRGMPAAEPMLNEMFSQNALDFVSMRTFEGYATYELFESYEQHGKVFLFLVKYYESANSGAIMTGGHCVLYLDHIPGVDDNEYMFLLRFEPGASVTHNMGNDVTHIPVKGWQVMSGKVEGTVQRVFIPDERRPSVQAALRITAYKNRTELAGSIEFV
jgi:hypothetical protein